VLLWLEYAVAGVGPTCVTLRSNRRSELAHTTLPLDSSLTLMEWVEEVFKSLSIGGWQIWEGVPPPQLLLVCYEQLPTTIQGEGALIPGASHLPRPVVVIST